MTTANIEAANPNIHTVKPINTPSFKLKKGTCRFCCARVTMTHNVKYTNGNIVKICRRCADLTN